MNTLDEFKINRILEDIAREKIHKEKIHNQLKDVETNDLIQELEFRLKTSIYAFCELCNIEGEKNCNFLLISHSELHPDAATLFCKKHTRKN